MKLCVPLCQYLTCQEPVSKSGFGVTITNSKSIFSTYIYFYFIYLGTIIKVRSQALKTCPHPLGDFSASPILLHFYLKLGSDSTEHEIE